MYKGRRGLGRAFDLFFFLSCEDKDWDESITFDPTNKKIDRRNQRLLQRRVDDDDDDDATDDENDDDDNIDNVDDDVNLFCQFLSTQLLRLTNFLKTSAFSFNSIKLLCII